MMWYYMTWYNVILSYKILYDMIQYKKATEKRRPYPYPHPYRVIWVWGHHNLSCIRPFLFHFTLLFLHLTSFLSPRYLIAWYGILSSFHISFFYTERFQWYYFSWILFPTYVWKYNRALHNIFSCRLYLATSVSLDCCAQFLSSLFVTTLCNDCLSQCSSGLTSASTHRL